MYSDNEKRKAYLKKWRVSPSGKAAIKKARERSKDWRKKWSKEYYKKNKEKILKQSTEYRKTHPEVTKRTQDKNRYKDILRGRKDRAILKPHYVNSLLKATSQDLDVTQKSAEILTKRIKNKISDISELKVCNRCKKGKLKSVFRKHGTKKDGAPILSAICNKCYSVVRKSYKYDKKKQIATNKRYYLKNREKIRIKQKLRNEKYKHTKKPSV